MCANVLCMSSSDAGKSATLDAKVVMTEANGGDVTCPCRDQLLFDDRGAGHGEGCDEPVQACVTFVSREDGHGVQSGERTCECEW